MNEVIRTSLQHSFIHRTPVGFWFADTGGKEALINGAQMLQVKFLIEKEDTERNFGTEMHLGSRECYLQEGNSYYICITCGRRGSHNRRSTESLQPDGKVLSD